MILRPVGWLVGTCLNARFPPVILTQVPLRGRFKGTYVKLTERIPRNRARPEALVVSGGGFVAALRRNRKSETES
jgi:hypothetical protein